MSYLEIKNRPCWRFFMIILFIISFSVFLNPYHDGNAERRKSSRIDDLDHDFPYAHCSLRVVDADIRAVLRAFADKYNLNILMSEDVKGNISIIVNDIPVKEAFLNILQYSELGYKKEDTVYRIKPMADLLNEQKLNQQAQELKTEIIPLSYANAERLSKNLQKFKSKLPETAIESDKWTNSIIVRDSAKKIEEIREIISQLDISAPVKEVEELKKTTKIIPLRYINCGEVAKIEGLKGKVSTHPQTNSIIITDIAENISNIASLIQDLDKPLRQVLIEAKIVETTKSYSTFLGIQWGGHWGGHYYTDPSSGKSFPTIAIGGSANASGKNTVNNYHGETPANYAVNLGTTLPTGSIDFLLGNIKQTAALNLRLSAMEDSGNGRVISQPRITTLDNTEATISSGETIQLPPVSTNSTTVITGGESTSSASTEKKAETKLKVTPHVISDNEIKLTISLNRDTPDYGREAVNDVPIIITREAKTTLIINDGETAVIGGLATSDISERNAGVPWLNQIPVLGWLFKSKANTSHNGELLVFITPHIIQSPDYVKAEN